MNIEEKLSKFEALLFLQGEPLSLKKIQSLLDIDQNECDTLISELEKRLSESHRGLVLVKDADKIQLATRPEFNKLLEDFIKEELSEDLSPASLEALAIVAYLGPISRSKIEYLRGVNSTFILRSLLLRGLVERYIDPEHTNSYLYRSTFDLLKHLGLSKKEELPEFEKFQELLKVFEAPTPTSESPISGSLENQPAEEGQVVENESNENTENNEGE